MGAVFLSYASADRAWAQRLARVMETHGHEVWWDRHIDGGEQFSTQIEAALDKADVVLVAWSKASVASRWVRDEAAIGADSDRLVPVTIDGTRSPMGFRQFQTVDLTGWKGNARDGRLAELLHSIERRAARNVGASPADPPPQAHPRSAFARISFGVILILLVFVGVSAWFLSDRLRPAAAVKPTIALAPFTTAPNDPQLRELASAARDSLAHTFSQSGIPLRLVETAQGRPGGADFVISGDLTRTGSTVVAAVRLDEAAHLVTVFSHKFEGKGDDAANLPERIGAQMAGDLTWAAPMMVLDRARPLDPDLIAAILTAYDFATGDALSGYQNAKRVASKAPDVAIIQTTLAFNTAFVLEELPRNERLQAVLDGRKAADRAIKLDPHFGDTYGNWCLLHSETLMSECEGRLRAGRRIDPDAPFLNSFLSQLMRTVGRFDEAAALTRLSYSHDPYVPTKISWMLLSAEYEGNHDEARQSYEQAMRWWPEFSGMFFRSRLRGLLERGDFDTLAALEKEVGSERMPSWYRNSGGLRVDWRSASAVRQTCSEVKDRYLMARCMLALAHFGYIDDAYALADKMYPRRVGRDPEETEKIWLDDPSGAGLAEFITSPAAAALRRDRRYILLAERTGLLAYWRKGQRPDFCQHNPESICAELLNRK